MSSNWEDDLPHGCIPVPPEADLVRDDLQGETPFGDLAFWTVTPALFEAGKLTVGPYETDIARILSDHSVKDITALEDARLLEHIVSIVGSPGGLLGGLPGAAGMGSAQSHVWNPPVNESSTGMLTTTNAPLDPKNYTLTNGPKQYVAGNAQAHGSFVSPLLREDHQGERPLISLKNGQETKAVMTASGQVKYPNKRKR